MYAIFDKCKNPINIMHAVFDKSENWHVDTIRLSADVIPQYELSHQDLYFYRQIPNQYNACRI